MYAHVNKWTKNIKIIYGGNLLCFLWYTCTQRSLALEFANKLIIKWNFNNFFYGELRKRLSVGLWQVLSCLYLLLLSYYLGTLLITGLPFRSCWYGMDLFWLVKTERSPWAILGVTMKSTFQWGDWPSF
jgi:hypothetical protein